MQSGNQILNFYKSASWLARLHLKGRWGLCPFPALIPYIPSGGTFLDVGCGYGIWPLYLAFSFPCARIYGIDPDTRKIDIARAAVQKAGLANIHLEVRAVPDAAWSLYTMVSLIDVLYLVPFTEQEQLLSQVVDRLKPKGRLIIKEMSESPRWKYQWNQLEEWLAVRILGITMGKSFYFRPQSGWESLLQRLGMTVKTVRLDRGYMYPHILFVGEKP